MSTPAGPFADLARQVRAKREEALREERARRRKAPRHFEPLRTSEPAVRCPYCHQPVDHITDCWVGRGQKAHDPCAWGVNDAFFLAFDVESERGEDANRQ